LVNKFLEPLLQHADRAQQTYLSAVWLRWTVSIRVHGGGERCLLPRIRHTHSL